MFTVNLIVADDVLATTGMTQDQLDSVIAGIEQAAALWSRYIDGNNAVIDIELDFANLSGSTLAQAGSSFFRQGNGPLQSEVINELNGQAGVFAADGTFTIDLDTVLDDRFFYSDSLDFDANPGAPGQIDFLTLAAHELGHVLGFLSLSFDGFVVNNEFIGANAVAANGGNPVPLADGVHTDTGDLLSPSISSNTREPLNPVLIAMLQDIGVPIAQATSSADVLYGYNQSDDTLNGAGGNDILNGLSGADMLNGGEGVDTASYQDSDGRVRVFTNSAGDVVGRDGDAEGDTLVSIENITGSDFDDLITFNSGSAVDNEANAGDGDDRIRDIDGGTNTFNGEGGEDRLIGGDGTDILNGGEDEDLLFGAGGNDILDGGSGDFRDELRGNAGNDTLTGNGGNDVLRGEGGIDTINGGTGNDSVVGGGGNDMLFGEEGDDTVIGDQGEDTIDGGSGNDRLFGGNNSDTFIFATDYDFDRIRDFQTNRDEVDLTDFNIADFATLQSMLVQDGSRVRIDFGGDDILTIENLNSGITIAQLDADNFIL